MKVLVGCEFSQVVCKAFRDRGHEAYSCDLLPTEGNPKWHIQRDIFDVIWGVTAYRGNWDLLIAHPPCTRICNSGVRWLAERNLWDEMKKSALFFKALLEATVYKIAVENPIPHKYALAIIGKKYDQIIQPRMFGHPETKATCLWLKNLLELKATNIIPKSECQQVVRKEPPSPERWKNRSRTYLGIAKAMAEQWG